MGVRRTILAGWLLAMASGLAWAQEAPSAAGLANIEAQRKAAAEAQGMDEALRAGLLEQYDEAIRQLRAADDWRAKASYFEQQGQRAPAELKGLQEFLKNPPQPSEVQIPPKATLPELEQALAQAETQYKNLQNEFDQLIREPARRADRRSEIAVLLASAQARVQEAENAIAAPPDAAEAQEVAAARRAAQQAKIEAARQEIAAYEQETASYDSRGELLSLLQEATKRRLADAELEFKAYQQAAATRRREEADKAAQEARQALQEITKANPAIRDRATALAEENAQLAEERTGAEGLTGKIESATALRDQEKGRLQQLNEEFDRVNQRVKASGLDTAVGVMLRKQKALLPDAADLRQEIQERRGEISLVQVAQNDLRERRLKLADTEQDLRKAVQALPATYTDYERNKISKVVSDLIQDQRGLNEALQRDYDRYYKVLSEVNSAQEQLAKQAFEFGAYINENILWIAGVSPFSRATFREIPKSFLWFVNPEQWRSVPRLLVAELLQNFEVDTPLLLLVLLGILLRGRLRAHINLRGMEARRKQHTRFAQTLDAFVFTWLQALPWPAALAFFAWRFQFAVERLDAPHAAAGALTTISFLWFCVAVMRGVLMTDGLATAHFGWPENRVRSGRRLLFWGALSALPFVFLLFVFEYQANETWKDAVGSILFALLMAVTAVFFYRVFWLARYGMQEARRTTWLAEQQRLHWPLHIAFAALPAALGVLALAGYYFTALHLAERFYWTLLLVLAVLTAVGLVRRWLLLARRAIAIAQAQRRRAVMKGESDAELDEQLDLLKIDAQTQTLVRYVALGIALAGMWFIWADVVPALSSLGDTELWPITVAKEEPVKGAQGQAEAVVKQTIDHIRLRHVALAALIAAITIFATRHFPAFIEIILLKRLHVGAGERYATLAVVRYIIIAVGVVLVFRYVGIGWSSVQWLVAALSVGLGFGLQEIFANFISGLILLFERPIRVGDTVTMGTVSGKVTQIRTRSTVIMDGDRKELIVPNKEFITGRIINWTLSDTLTRVTVPVSLAYGSNIEQAIATLLEIVSGHPDVLKEPAPQVSFTGFGEALMSLEVRAFCADVDTAHRVKHELYVAIEKAFRDAGAAALPQWANAFRPKHGTEEEA